MLDGRVLEASQVEYKPFGKPPLQRELRRCLGCCLGRCLGCCLGHGCCLGCSLGRRLGLCGKSQVRFIRRLHGQVVDHFFLFARSSIIFLLFGRGSSGLGLFFFRIENIFFKRPSGD